MNDAEALMLAGADARILADDAAPLIHRIGFLKSWKQQTGEISDVGQASLDSARRELYELLRTTAPLDR
jgi:hypothetical protein